MLESRKIEFLLLGSTTRVEKFPTGSKTIHRLDLDLVREFAPTHVVDFAFLTRERLGKFPLEHYVAANRRLIKEANTLLSIPSVKTFLSTSSGAAVHQIKKDDLSLSSNPYGYLKRESELSIMSHAKASGVSLAIARPWSVTGEFVTKVEGFAFSQMISSALRTRTINILSKRRVYRKYVDLEDFLEVCLTLAGEEGSSRIIDSGGELVDLVELSERVSQVLGFEITVNHSVDDSLEPDSYFSDGTSWDEGCRQLDYFPLNLESQIEKVTRALLIRETD